MSSLRRSMIGSVRLALVRDPVANSRAQRCSYVTDSLVQGLGSQVRLVSGSRALCWRGCILRGSHDQHDDDADQREHRPEKEQDAPVKPGGDVAFVVRGARPGALEALLSHGALRRRAVLDQQDEQHHEQQEGQEGPGPQEGPAGEEPKKSHAAAEYIDGPRSPPAQSNRADRLKEGRRSSVSCGPRPRGLRYCACLTALPQLTPSPGGTPASSSS